MLNDIFDKLCADEWKEEFNAGWHISRIKTHGFTMNYCIQRTEPEFSIELCRKEKY